MKKISFFLFFLVIGATAFAQTKKGVVRGRIVDAVDKAFAPGATISVQKLPDSTVVGFTISDENGSFEYRNLAEGNYRLIVKLTGSAILKKEFQITPSQWEINLGNLELQPETIQGIEVKGEVAPVEIKQDTVEFNARAFQTKPNATAEDLLKKLPGVEVSKDGTIKAQGETVRKVLVDGKPFFSDDPKIATRNIPKDMIDKVQIIDQLSEQSQLTGVDDGNREKVINITTKKDMKKGTFGRAMAGVGTNDRYEGNLSLNRFNDDQQISFIASANNINSQNFTLNNAIQGAGNFRGNFQRIAQAFGAANLNNNNGITTVWSAGLNFNDEWGKKWKINGNYFYNNSELVVSQNAKRQNILTDSTFFTFQNNDNTTQTGNHRLNFRIDYEIDSLTLLRVIPNLSVTQVDYNNLSISRTLNSNQNTLLNDANTENISKNNQLNFNNQLLFRRRFKKRGRSFVGNFNFTNTTQEGTDFNTALNRFYNNNNLITQRLIRQKATQDNSSLLFRGGISYTEPLSRRHNLEMNYQISNTNNLTDRRVFDFDEIGGDYLLPNAPLTNNFDNQFLSHRLGLNLVTTKLKYSYTLGFAAQFATQNNQDITRDTTFRRTFINLFPTAQFRYNFGKNRRMRIEYQGST
ncbi:MAG: outer membrane beta-barrel protein, partial [Raineya sp.]|nr:outer membrane beta-barrel protein [Raineya sp.]